jgi:hypothetical protein
MDIPLAEFALRARQAIVGYEDEVPAGTYIAKSDHVHGADRTLPCLPSLSSATPRHLAPLGRPQQQRR